MSNEAARLAASPPAEVEADEAERLDEARRKAGPLFSEAARLVTYTSGVLVNEDEPPVHEADYNVLLVGPAGVGKSSIINLLFNEMVCKTLSVGSGAVTRRHAAVYKGTCPVQDQQVAVNLIDTMGFDDTYSDQAEFAHQLQLAVASKVRKLDRVAVVCSERIQEEHIDSIRSCLRWLNYENNMDNFVFLYNKTENFSEEDKMEQLREMGRVLEIDVDYYLTVKLPSSNSRNLVCKNYIPSGLCIGFNKDKWDNSGAETSDILKDSLLPHSKNDLRVRKRLTVEPPISQYLDNV